MPFRNPILGAVLHHRRSIRPRCPQQPHPMSRKNAINDNKASAAALHTSIPRHDDNDTSHHHHHGPATQTHYETLNVSPDATPTEIKRSFYALSKAHHPDHNPSDASAARRFMRISEAYTVLSHSEKRARYDRDVLRRHGHAVPHRQHPKGSYHSSNPAGGRAASGLSRRRGTFQGPPPSFFRSGGWGSYGAKRRAAHEESTGTGTSGSSGTAGSAGKGEGKAFDSAGGPASTGGMGPGQNPYRAQADRDNEVPHFDRVAHERTQRRHDERREQRMRASRRLNPFGSESNPTADFFVVAAIVAAGVLGPYLFVGMWMSDTKVGRKDR